MPPNNRRESHAPLPKAVLITLLYAVGKKGSQQRTAPAIWARRPATARERPVRRRGSATQCHRPVVLSKRKGTRARMPATGYTDGPAGAGEPNRQPPPARPTSRTGVLPARAHVKDGGRSADGSRGIVRRLHLGGGLGRRRPVQRPGGLIFTRRRSRECCRAGGGRFRAALP